MVHFLGYAAIAVVGGAVGYWLRGQNLEDKLKEVADKCVRKDETPNKIEKSSEQTTSSGN